MTALYKKIHKLLKPKNFAVVIGENPDLVSEICKIFRTVFIYDDSTKAVREKNLVYRGVLGNDEKLNEIEAVFLADLEKAESLRHLYNTINKEKPAVIIYSADLPKESICKWLANDMGYRITHQEKKMYVWKKEK